MFRHYSLSAKISKLSLKNCQLLSKRNMSDKSTLFFRQLFEKESSTYTYILGDLVTKEAVLIDSVLETVERFAIVL